MKKSIILLFILLCLGIGKGKAQFNTYHPFPNSNAWWSEKNINNTLKSTYYDYYLSGDTVVNAKTYFKLRHSGGYVFPPGIWQSYDSLTCLLREDTSAKRIYASFKPNLGIKDTLLYDFNLKTGDTLPPGIINVYPQDIVKSIDSILIGNKYRKQFIVSNAHSVGWRDSIIEGIGSTEGLLMQIAPLAEGSNTLLCFKQKDTTIYPFLNDSCQEFVLNVSSIKAENHKISLFPNPNKGIFTISLSHAELVSASQAMVEIYNVLGEKVLTQILHSAQDDKVIDLSKQPTGIYFYRVIKQTGELLGDGKLIIQK